MLINHKTLVVRVALLAVLGVVIGLTIRWAVSSDAGTDDHLAADFRPFSGRDQPEASRRDAQPSEASEPEVPGERVGDDMAARGVAAQTEPAPEYFARPDNEWQGMRVETSSRPPCEASEFCGRALACIGEKCLPCEHDADCAHGESCVLDHCVKSHRVDCKSERDCGPAALCMLTGYSSDPRGNSKMRAICQSDSGGQAAEASPDERIADKPDDAKADEDGDHLVAPRRELAPSNLIERARSAEQSGEER